MDRGVQRQGFHLSRVLQCSSLTRKTLQPNMALRQMGLVRVMKLFERAFLSPGKRSDNKSPASQQVVVTSLQQRENGYPRQMPASNLPGRLEEDFKNFGGRRCTCKKRAISRAPACNKGFLFMEHVLVLSKPRTCLDCSLTTDGLSLTKLGIFALLSGYSRTKIA